MQKAIFVDRDGVVIENRDQYVRSVDDVVFIPGSIEAICQANAGGWKVVIVSNQAGIGKGLISWDDAREINRQMLDEINQQGGRVDGIFFCPHTNEDNCACRKPKPGMILQAAQELTIDLSQSVMIGDALTDILAGLNAGVPRQILVKTGRGTTQARMPEAQALGELVIFPDLLSAISSLNADYS